MPQIRMALLLLTVVTFIGRCHSFSTSSASSTSSLFHQHQQQQAARGSSECLIVLSSNNEDHDPGNTLPSDLEYQVSPTHQHSTNRRQALASLAAITMALPTIAATATSTLTDDQPKSLEDLQFATGQWKSTSFASANSGNMVVPAYFATYLARFLIQYDAGVAVWWNAQIQSFALLDDQATLNRQGRVFANFAESVQLGIRDFLLQELKSGSCQNVQECYGRLGTMLQDKYVAGNSDAVAVECQKQIALLFAMLPPTQQPVTLLNPTGTKTSSRRRTAAPTQTQQALELSTKVDALLPSNQYQVVRSSSATAFTIEPPLQLYEVGIEEEFGQTAVATPFGPLASSPLIRDLPQYSFNTYALFGISGATGCALTHSVVIPLDVVKTKAQTNPEQFAVASGAKLNLLASASRIVDQQGVSGLFTGAQATIAGYFWYGLSVYPTYTFSKRWLGQTVLSPEMAMIHGNDIALIAGAMAAVVASVGLTPLEAARIRVVAEPDQYKSLGLVGTLQSIGLGSAYAGFPSLLARQVIFGSVKFLAFERACDAIYQVNPTLRDSIATTLLVSLTAGAISGCLSSVVSQPADSVLTYVAQNSGKNGKSLGVVDGCIQMVKEDGPSSLFRGLGSRCIWAGSIIAGQFLLYDVFRTYFGVSGQDLSQVYQITIGG